MGIVIIVLPILLWRFANSGKIDHWSPFKGGIIALSLLLIALYLQSFWGALVIEGWQFRTIPQDENSYPQQAMADIVSSWLRYGRKTGWLFVAISATICLLRAWRLSFANRWLILSAAWISTFTLIGSLLELFAPIPVYVYFGITQEQSAMLALQQMLIWIVLLAILYIVLIRTSTKPSSS